VTYMLWFRRHAIGLLNKYYIELGERGFKKPNLARYFHIVLHKAHKAHKMVANCQGVFAENINSVWYRWIRISMFAHNMTEWSA
jgi:hypothetical protein